MDLQINHFFGLGVFILALSFMVITFYDSPEYNEWKKEKRK